MSNIVCFLTGNVSIICVGWDLGNLGTEESYIYISLRIILFLTKQTSYKYIYYDYLLWKNDLAVIKNIKY